METYDIALLHREYTIMPCCVCFMLLIITVIVKATNGPRYVVGCRRQVGVDQINSKQHVLFHLYLNY